MKPHQKRLLEITLMTIMVVMGGSFYVQLWSGGIPGDKIIAGYFILLGVMLFGGYAVAVWIALHREWQ